MPSNPNFSGFFKLFSLIERALPALNQGYRLVYKKSCLNPDFRLRSSKIAHQTLLYVRASKLSCAPQPSNSKSGSIISLWTLIFIRSAFPSKSRNSEKIPKKPQESFKINIFHVRSCKIFEKFSIFYKWI